MPLLSTLFAQTAETVTGFSKAISDYGITVVALVIVSVGGVILLRLIYTLLNTRLNECNAEIARQREVIGKLVIDKENLMEQVTILKTEKTQLEHTIAVLQDKYDKLSQKLVELTKRFEAQ